MNMQKGWINNFRKCCDLEAPSSDCFTAKEFSNELRAKIEQLYSYGKSFSKQILSAWDTVATIGSK